MELILIIAAGMALGLLAIYLLPLVVMFTVWLVTAAVVLLSIAIKSVFGGEK